jgi:hypothetical protein
MSQGRATAGDQITVSMTLDAPTACGGEAYVEFAPSKPGRGLELRGPAPEGQTKISFTAQIPFDQPGEEYTAKSGLLSPCPGYSVNTQLSFAAVNLTVIPFSETKRFPTTAKVELSLTQQQFLDIKIAQLSDLNSQLSTKLEGHAADLPLLRDDLASVVQSAEDALSVTEEQYRTQIMKPKESLPALFADFHAPYQELLIELKTPIPGIPLSSSEPDAKLIYVQLKKRAPIEQLANTWPSIAKTVWGTIKDNIAAYLFIRNNGTDKFTVAISSYPKGASIQVKKLTDDDYSDYGQTNIPSASFELATWTFKFHHPDCSDERVLHIDPYEDTQSAISAEFMHCKGR